MQVGEHSEVKKGKYIMIKLCFNKTKTVNSVSQPKLSLAETRSVLSKTEVNALLSSHLQRLVCHTHKKLGLFYKDLVKEPEQFPLKCDNKLVDCDV